MTVPSPDEIKADVERWFAANGVAGLILPDGWFGRPHDSQHRLTWLASRPQRLLVELDGRVILLFVAPGSVESTPRELVVDGASHVVVSWSASDSSTAQLKTYAGGAVHFVGVPG